MKFKEIERFTQRPTYHVNTDLDYIETWIQNNIDELGLQMNPDFQRGHVWTKEQQIAYMEYLLRGGSSGKDFYFNRTGGFNDFRNLKADFVCVDGLQRITAILAFLHNEIPIFEHYRRDFDENLRMADVMFSMYVNDLKTKKDVLIWYIEMNSGGTPHKPEEIEKVKKYAKNREINMLKVTIQYTKDEEMIEAHCLKDEIYKMLYDSEVPEMEQNMDIKVIDTEGKVED